MHAKFVLYNCQVTAIVLDLLIDRSLRILPGLTHCDKHSANPFSPEL